MIEFSVSIGTVAAVLIALVIWDVVKYMVRHSLAEKADKPQKETAEEAEKRRKEEAMLDGFNSLMRYDMDSARAAVRGDLE